jgi:hypothetical protein
MARDWRGLCPAMDCGRLMMMMMTLNWFGILAVLQVYSIKQAYFVISAIFDLTQRQ